MRQLQFKFDPLPTEPTRIYLFHQSWIKTFHTQPFCQLFIKYGLIFQKIDLVQFCDNYLVVSSQKNSFSALKKMKNDFFRPKEMKTSLGNIVFHSNMHPCAQYEIIRTNYAMNVTIRLIIWLENPESSSMIYSSFLRTLFKNNYRITSLLFFLVTWSHIMTQCEGFPIL